jgi:hypothetical protein
MRLMLLVARHRGENASLVATSGLVAFSARQAGHKRAGKGHNSNCSLAVVYPCSSYILAHLTECNSPKRQPDHYCNPFGECQSVLLEDELVLWDARECAPGPQGRPNRPPSMISPGVGRRRRPIDGLWIDRADSYVA